MNNKKWKQYLNEECGCGMAPRRKTQGSPSRGPADIFRASVNSLPMVVDPHEDAPSPMPMVAGPHEDVPLEDEDEHEHEGAHEHMPPLEPEDESPYPENIDELVAMIADLLNDFLKNEGEEEHDCDEEHPEESHEHWKMKNLLGKGSSPCG